MGSTPEAAGREIDNLLEIFTLLEDDRGIFDRWLELVRTVEVRGKPAHDARLVAAMRRHEVDTLLTANPGDFGRFADIHVLTPADILDGQA